MLDLADIRRDPETWRRGLARKGAADRLQELLDADVRHRELLTRVEALRARQNAASEGIAKAKRAGADAAPLLAEMKGVKEEISALGADLEAAAAAVESVLRVLPNPPDADVPDGASAEGNVEIAAGGPEPRFDFAPRAHQEILAGLGGADPETAGAMSGSGFAILRGDAALLERALGQFLLDLASRSHGYTEVSVPLLLRREMMDSVTIAAKFREDMYRTTEEDGLYLIPTAEHPLTNLHRDAILEEESLPRRYTALTPCFRREAGAAGKDTRGLLRVHQFWKVEMMAFAHPDRSREEHERMLGNARAALDALGLRYRVVFVCTGDMGSANRRQYDLEVWAPGEKRWLEVSSISNFGDWQARRCGTRCRSGKAKPRFVHTLNGSALGMPRVLVGILETFQRSDGSVAVPEVLRKYMGGRDVLAPPAGA